MAMGSNLSFKVTDQSGRSETHLHPIASVAGRLKTAIDGIKWSGQPGPIPYAATVSTFCHTRNYFQTCHIYNSTPDSTKRVSDTMTPVSMATTEKGAGYTATSARGSSMTPAALPSMPVVTKPRPNQPRPPQKQYPLPSIPTIDSNAIYILGGLVILAIIGSVMFR